jgi:hypothetical protein
VTRHLSGSYQVTPPGPAAHGATSRALTGTDRSTEGPLRRGSTFTAVFRPPGSSATYDLIGEMTVYEPGRLSELQALFAEPRGRVPAMIGRFVLTFHVEQEGSRTRLTRDVQTRGAALRYRLLWLLLTPLSRRSGQARQGELLGRIKTILETSYLLRASWVEVLPCNRTGQAASRLQAGRGLQRLVEPDRAVTGAKGIAHFSKAARLRRLPRLKARSSLQVATGAAPSAVSDPAGRNST